MCYVARLRASESASDEYGIESFDLDASLRFSWFDKKHAVHSPVGTLPTILMSHVLLKVEVFLEAPPY